MREDHQELVQALEQNLVGVGEDVHPENYISDRLQKKAGFSIRLTNLQRSISIFGLISNFPLRVLTIIKASSYYSASRHNEIAAGGLYLNVS